MKKSRPKVLLFWLDVLLWYLHDLTGSESCVLFSQGGMTLAYDPAALQNGWVSGMHRLTENSPSPAWKQTEPGPWSEAALCWPAQKCGRGYSDCAVFPLQLLPVALQSGTKPNDRSDFSLTLHAFSCVILPGWTLCIFQIEIYFQF